MDVPCDDRKLAGIELRYVLTCHLLDAASILSVRDLVRMIEADGFVVDGRASKTVSDSLRWEVGRGRVRRVGRGLYMTGSMPRQTKSRLRRRVHGLRHVVATTRGIDLLHGVRP